jgi:hypothetical protein
MTFIRSRVLKGLIFQGQRSLIIHGIPLMIISNCARNAITLAPNSNLIKSLSSGHDHIKLTQQAYYEM